MKKFVDNNLVKVPKWKSGNRGFHGDVLLFMEALPENFELMEKCTEPVLAYGEATGHLHMLFSDGEVDLRECKKTNQKYLRLVEPATLKHQEHNPIQLPPGTYRIGIQKEYDHFDEEIRSVID